MATVAEAVTAAQSVLDTKIHDADLPGLTGRVQASEDLVGFFLSTPHPSDRHQQVCASPAVPLGDATEANLQNAFDEGLRVIKEKRDEVSA